MYKEATLFHDLVYDSFKVATFIEYLIDNPSLGIALVVVDEEEIVGGFLSMITEYWFSSDLYSTDIVHFLLPEYRTGRIAIDLINRYVREAKMRGAKKILIGNTSNINKDKVMELYRRLGFEQIGGNFMKGVS